MCDNVQSWASQLVRLKIALGIIHCFIKPHTTVINVARTNRLKSYLHISIVQNIKEQQRISKLKRNHYAYDASFRLNVVHFTHICGSNRGELLHRLALLKNWFQTGANLPMKYQKFLTRGRLEGTLNKVSITAGVARLGSGREPRNDKKMDLPLIRACQYIQNY